MTKYREILRLKSLGFSERNIAQSAGVSRNTVSKVLKRADELNLAWPIDFGMTDNALEEIMFPKEKTATKAKRIAIQIPKIQLAISFTMVELIFFLLW